MQNLRVGVVGVGHLGQHHARNFTEIEGCQLVGVVDVDHKSATRIAHQFQTQAFFDHKTLIGQVDAASIVVPTTLHYAVAKDLLEAGIHLLVEKPFTATIEEARELIEIARARDLVLQVGHIVRFEPTITKLREILTKPAFIETHRLGPYDPRVRDVGVVLDLMIHDIDLTLQIAQSPIVSIDAVGVPILSPREDIANARIRFESGCTANLTVSRVSPNRMRKIRLFQPNTYVSIDFLKQSMEVYHTEQIKDAREGEPQAQIVRKRLKVKKEEPLKRELTHFLSCIREGREPEVTGEHGQNALDVAIKVVEKIQENVGNLEHLLKNE